MEYFRLRTIFSGNSYFVLLPLLVFHLAIAHAAAEPPTCSFGLINAVSLPARTHILLDGKSLFPAGLTEGQFTEGFAIPAGKHQIEIRNDACKPLSASLEARTDASPVLVLYKITKAQNGGKSEDQLKIVAVPNQPAGRGYTYYAYYAAEAETVATIEVKGQPLEIKALQLTKLEHPSPLTVKTEDYIGRYSPHDQGNYLLVLFKDSTGKLRQRLIQEKVFGEQ